MKAEILTKKSLIDQFSYMKYGDLIEELKEKDHEWVDINSIRHKKELSDILQECKWFPEEISNEAALDEESCDGLIRSLRNDPLEKETLLNVMDYLRYTMSDKEYNAALRLIDAELGTDDIGMTTLIKEYAKAKLNQYKLMLTRIQDGASPSTLDDEIAQKIYDEHMDTIICDRHLYINKVTLDILLIED